MKKIIEAVTPLAKDSGAESTRWTRPMIRELGRVTGTEAGPHTEHSETAFHNVES